MRFLAAIACLVAIAGHSLGQPTLAVGAALADVARYPGDKTRIRYLWIDHDKAAERQLAWQVCSGWIHGQSRQPNLVPPAVILTNGTVANPFALQGNQWLTAELIRVNLDDYRFSPKVWDDLGFQDPYFHLVLQARTGTDKETGKPIYLDGKTWRFGAQETILASAPWLAETQQDAANITALLLATQCQTPILRADNFIWQIAIQDQRKVGYYGLLEIKDQRSYERTVGFDPKADVDPGFLDEVIAAVGKSDSRVAEQNRRVERRQGLSPYWVTKDNKSTEKEERNPLRTLNGTLRYDALEAYGQNPCGFWVTGLFNEQGKRIDSAPDFVGHDTTTHDNDGRIHVGLSCFSCHRDGGLQDVADYFRRFGAGNRPRPLQTIDPKRVSALRHYAAPLEPYLQRDRERYAASLFAVTGLKPAEFAVKLRQYYAAYDRGVTLERAIKDTGFHDLQERLEKYTNKTLQADTVLATWLLPVGQQGTVGIEDYHQSFNTLQLQARGFAKWPTK